MKEYDLTGTYTAGQFAGFAKKLTAWYHKAARRLPWREEPTPYRVWVSEVMLQQTRVQAVIPYFNRFVAELPGPQALAAATEEQLAKLWQGLGYYSRVRNLQKAASIVTEQYGGFLPASYEALLRLPGFGPYTAGAVASIAFGIPVPAVDGNVLRVFARLCASEDDITQPAVKQAVTRLVAALLPQEHPGDFNQALMELGATVCMPNGVPKCSLCPVQGYCLGYKGGNPQLLPVRAPKKEKLVQQKTVLLVVKGQCVLLHKRPPKGLLASLWEFPNIEGHLEKEAVQALVRHQGLQLQKIEELPKATHIFTHIKWLLGGYLLVVKDGTTAFPADEFAWASRQELLTKYALPSAFRGYQEYLLSGESLK